MKNYLHLKQPSDDPELKSKVKAFGIDYCVEMCQKLIASKKVPGLHFYTLNMSTTTITIVNKLGYESNTVKTVKHKKKNEVFFYIYIYIYI